MTHDIINISLRNRPKKNRHITFYNTTPHFPKGFLQPAKNSGGQPVEILQNAETSGALERCHLSCAWCDECQLSTWLRTSTLHTPLVEALPLLRNTPIIPGLKEHGNHRHHHAFGNKGGLCSERMKVKTSIFLQFWGSEVAWNLVR